MSDATFNIIFDALMKGKIVMLNSMTGAIEIR